MVIFTDRTTFWVENKSFMIYGSAASMSLAYVDCLGYNSKAYHGPYKLVKSHHPEDVRHDIR